MVDEVGFSASAGYSDIVIQFSCSFRYLSHSPSSEGDTLRVRLMPQTDCLFSRDDIIQPLLPSALRSVVTELRIERPFNNEVQLLIHWRAKEQFLVLPSATGSALRVRVLGKKESTGKVLIQDSDKSTGSAYALNLMSSRTPFDRDAIDAAASAVQTFIYVSETEIDGQHWYRLRAGPYILQSDAQRSLLAVRGRYPQAWLAIGDDEKLTTPSRAPLSPAPAATLPVTTNLPAALAVTEPLSQATPPDEPKLEAPSLVSSPIDASTPITAPAITSSVENGEREAWIKQARTAFKKKDYATALPLLTKLVEQPEYLERAEMQELLGLVHERNGHIAHAKAEYEEYLRRYPKGDAVERVEQRLRALKFAARQSVKGLRAADNEQFGWSAHGGLSQFYRYDDSFVDLPDEVNPITKRSALVNDMNLSVRRHGQRYDLAGRFSGTYIHNLSDVGAGYQFWVNNAFVEFSDQEWAWRSRIGRQSALGSGVYGKFDGLYTDYQWQPWLRLSLSAGAPVVVSVAPISRDKRIVALAANFGPYANAWNITTYTSLQQFQGEVDRRAIGTEVNYFAPGRSAVGIVDYDVYFGEINNIFLLGTLQLPRRWFLNANYDYRRSPSLSIRNALIGQSTVVVEELLQTYTQAELRQLALDRTAPTESIGVSASVPSGDHWQWTLDVSRIAMDGMPASGNVPSLPGIKPEFAYTMLAIGNGVFTSRDTELIALRYQTGAIYNTATISFNSRWPFTDGWRVGPRLRVDRRTWVNDDSTQMLYSPSLRIEYQRKQMSFELEAGVEFGTRDVTPLNSVSATEKTIRNYLSAGYRWQF
jgi:tetratricopeptide (TPR) repeat protein